MAADLESLPELSLAGDGGVGCVSRDPAAAQFHRFPGRGETDRWHPEPAQRTSFRAPPVAARNFLCPRHAGELELDEEQFAGTGVYTFASVIDVFLGLYTSMNSFSQLAVRTRQRKRVLKQWPPRAGQKILM